MKSLSKTDWNRLKKMDDSNIDYSDIPEITSDFWNDAQIITTHKKIKVNLELDEDIAIWLKQFGNNSDKTINALLRSYYSTIQNLQARI